MYIVQRLGRDGCWHDLLEEVYSLARVASFRAYELSFESPDRVYRAKSQTTGEVLIVFGPEGVKIPKEDL